MSAVFESSQPLHCFPVVLCCAVCQRVCVCVQGESAVQLRGVARPGRTAVPPLVSSQHGAGVVLELLRECVGVRGRQQVDRQTGRHRQVLEKLPLPSQWLICMGSWRTCMYVWLCGIMHDGMGAVHDVIDDSLVVLSVYKENLFS